MKQIIKKIIRRLKRLLKSFISTPVKIKPYTYQKPSFLKQSIAWTDKPIKICVIGAGKQGRAIAKAAASIDGCSLSGLCDLEPKRLALAHEQDGVSKDVLFSSIDDALSNKETDIVFIATNAPSHCDVTLEALKYNVKRLCVEKPIATSLEQALKIKAASEDRFIAVNHSRRWNLDYKHILNVIERNALGSPVYAHICWGPAGMGNIGVHLIDLVRMLCKNPMPQSVHGQLDDTRADDPGGTTTIEFDNGLTLFLNTSEKLKTFSKHIDIYFEKGSIRIDENLSEWTINIAGHCISYPMQDNGRNTARAQRVISGIIDDVTPSSSIHDGIVALECVLAIQASSVANEVLSAPFDDIKNLIVRAR